MKLLKITAILVVSILVVLGVWLANRTIECVVPSDEHQLSSIQTALILFYIDTHRFPTNDEGLGVLVAGSDRESIKGYKSGGYIDELRNDRWKNPYHYLNYKQKNGVETVVIWTYGADELPGGDEDKIDIYRYLEADNILKKTQP